MSVGWNTESECRSRSLRTFYGNYFHVRFLQFPSACVTNLQEHRSHWVVHLTVCKSAEVLVLKFAFICQPEETQLSSQGTESISSLRSLLQTTVRSVCINTMSHVSLRFWEKVSGVHLLNTELNKQDLSVFHVYTIQCFQNPKTFSGFSCTLHSFKQCGGLIFYRITLVLQSFWEEHGRTCPL